MASLRSWYIGQLVTSQEMIGGDEALEAGTTTLCTDLGLVGIISGFSVAEHAGTPNLTVDVAAGLARTPNGERVRTGNTVTVNCAFDYLGNPTAVNNPGNSKLLDVYAVFDRIPSDPRLDATNTTIYFIQDEGFGFDVVQGAEAASPSAPSPLADGVLLARITITFGQTQIVNADIDTDVAANLVKLTGTPFSVTAGSVLAALQAIVTRYDQHVTGVGDPHAGAGLNYGGSGPWADSTSVGSGTMEAAVDGVVSALAGTGAGTSGDYKIGVAQDATFFSTLAAGTLHQRLLDLRNAANIGYGGGSSWVNSASNPSQSLEAIIDSIILDLSSTTNSGRGTGGAKIGMSLLGNFTNSSVHGYFAELVATTASNDGALRVGAESVSSSPTSLTQGTVRSQLTALLTAVNARARFASAETISGAWTHTAELVQPRLVPGFIDIGTIAANTTIAANVGLVRVAQPGTNTTYNVALPTPASGNPVVMIRFSGPIAASRTVYITTPADVATANPSDYYGLWGPSASAGAYLFAWTGTQWEMMAHQGGVAATSGGALA